MNQPVAQRYIGESVERSEDKRILSGAGRYVDDVNLPGMLHLAFLRSPFAHATIGDIDISEAEALPGVVAVLTSDSLNAFLGHDDTPPGIFGMPSPFAFHLLSNDKARLVGDLIVAVVAETRYIAEDALELIEVDYDPLDAVADMTTAFDPASPPIFEDFGSNVVKQPETWPFGDVEGVFASADRIITETISLHRHQNVPMECRGTVADYDAEADHLTVHSSNQGVGMTKMGIAGHLRMDDSKVRVLCGDIGGSFGLKAGASREEIVVCAASKMLGRPVKWSEDRNEHLSASGHAREETLELEAAITDDGVIRGLKAKMTVDGGAYPGMAPMLGGIVQKMFPGPYKMEAFEFTHAVAITNKASYVAYRGPWAAETFARERLIDIVAAEIGVEPAEIRFRNLAPAGEHPGTMITGSTLDGITIRESLEVATSEMDLAGFRKRQADARAEGRHLGLGFATYIESAPGPRGEGPLGAEMMRMRLEPDGTVTVFTAQMPHGQSHETTFAQIVAEQMGVPFEQVKIVAGDSDVVPFGFTGGSRAATMAGGASLHTARALRDRVLELASHVLEASADDLEIVDGNVGVRGVPAKAVPLAEIAAAASAGGLPDDVDTSLEVEHTYDGGEGGWSGGTHAVEVEVDVETGLVRVERYLVAEDCGKLINPAVVDGQIRGGTVQGIGAVLFEHSAYDEEGNFLAGSFMDYLLPTMTDIPRIEVHHLETVPRDADVNFRGVGEGGMIVAPAAVCNAIEDALSPFGVRVREQHLPPLKIMELIGAV